jgi:chorismate--pyruvate lyase
MVVENSDRVADNPSGNQWHSLPELTGSIPEPAIHSWLAETGLLTARLRTLCADSFHLEVLGHSAPASSQLARRRIVLWCGNAPCVYAETIIPATTITEHAWLTTLGDEPLGERLSSQPGVSRSPFRYCRMALPAIPENVIESDGLHWSRQSDFRIAKHSLTVTEVFLPGILDCENTSGERINS